MEYKILKAESSWHYEAVASLEKLVNEYLKDGWLPAGGVHTVYRPGTNQFSFTVTQALLREC